MFILASSSAARAGILRSAGIDFTQESVRLDEEALRLGMTEAGLAPDEQAMGLAEMKALKVSARREGVVLGADQMLVCAGEVFSKPQDMEQARHHLRHLSGKMHFLATAVCACEGGQMIWRHLARPRLWMRELPESFLQGYLEAEGEKILQMPGCYCLEGRGVQLFSRIEGDYFSILGLPLLPLLVWLRDRGVLS